MRLFEGLEDPFQVWMSHGDKLSGLPEGFFDIGATSNAEHAAIASEDRVMYGIQFHPEVTHTPQGHVILRNFVLGICGAKADWEMGSDSMQCWWTMVCFAWMRRCLYCFDRSLC